MGRLLAIDFGIKRTGIAVTDELKLIASGLTTILTKELLHFLEDYTQKECVDLIIVGEPKRMNNLSSESELAIQNFIKKLKLAIPQIPIKRYDERFTSKMAFQAMIDGGVKKQKRKNKALIDEISATLILQGYMDSIR